MATLISMIIDVVDTLKATDAIYANISIPIKHSKLGVIQGSIALDKDYTLIKIATTDSEGLSVEVDGVQEDLTSKEIYLCGLYAYRNYIMQEHQSFVQKAVNFKTINFAVTGLTERAKEVMRIVWFTDGEIEKTLNRIQGRPLGSTSEMKGNAYGDDTYGYK